MPKMGTKMRLYTPPKFAILDVLNVLDKLFNCMTHSY
jgi:hypothetical protein